MLKALSRARAIILLGFGFHRQNMELLTSGEDQIFNTTVFATTFGIHPENGAAISNSLRQIHKMPTAERVHLYQMTANDLLMNLRPTISGLVG